MATGSGAASAACLLRATASPPSGSAALSSSPASSSWMERSSAARAHLLRFIGSAADGDQYQDLKPLIRRRMTRTEEDPGAEFDWVTVYHHNTGHPHSHVILRGIDERGRDLLVAPDYLSAGMRERAAEIVSLDLGARSDLETESRLRNDINKERLTIIDRRLLRDREQDGLVYAADGDAFRQSLRPVRLQKLRRLRLADEVIGRTVSWSRPWGAWASEATSSGRCIAR